MGRRPVDPLSAEHEELMQAHEALVREFNALERAPFDAAAHRKHAQKLHAHIDALKAHIALLRQTMMRA